MATNSMDKKIEKILKDAEKKGAESNYFFVTTFKRYQVQMQVLEALEKAISEEGPTVEKEYVKGRKNIYANPAISEYNKTATAANNTVQTLIKILTTLDGGSDNSKAGEALVAFVAKGKNHELR